tara:strand:- start:7326 stop:7763 length:438 start_codon:yes stop_codon:yes gene_type:complete
MNETYRNGNYEGHGYDDWQTPQKIIDQLEKEFGKLFDPCPKDWDGETDGLSISWMNSRYNFVNPPYGNMKAWVKKCHDEWLKGRGVILLIPPRTCSSYFHDWIYEKAELRFIRGRLKFIDGRNPTAKPKGAPFPSMLCIFRRGNQ